jgi:hypothetical protein
MARDGVIEARKQIVFHLLLPISQEHTDLWNYSDKLFLRYDTLERSYLMADYVVFDIPRISDDNLM